MIAAIGADPHVHPLVTDGLLFPGSGFPVHGPRHDRLGHPARISPEPFELGAARPRSVVQPAMGAKVHGVNCDKNWKII